jgi:hypothetical protein
MGFPWIDRPFLLQWRAPFWALAIPEFCQGKSGVIIHGCGILVSSELTEVCDGEDGHESERTSFPGDDTVDIVDALEMVSLGAQWEDDAADGLKSLAKFKVSSSARLNEINSPFASIRVKCRKSRLPNVAAR